MLYRSHVAALLAAVSVLAATPTTATAATTVTGAQETNAPLVIDPTGSPDDPETIDAYFSSMGRLAFIERMPGTKTISQVTLGDIGSSESCSSPVSARLFVHEHPDGDLANAQQIAYSEDLRDLPSTPGKVSWPIPPTTLRKGKGYSFTVGWENSSCPHGRLTTWAHNQPTVDGGSVRCTGGAPAAPSGNPVVHRMWHATGQADRDPGCVSYPTDWAFHYSMPEGWLATDRSGWYVLSGTGHTQPSAESLCGTRAAEAGAHSVFWRNSPTDPFNNEWVCMWPQFGPLNQTTDHGWYYGMPWRSDGIGAPRDVYLKLDTIDYDTLLQLHAPHLLFDRDDNYRADSPSMHADSPWTTLVKSYGTATGPPWLDDLDATYHGTGEAAEGDFLDRYPSGTDAAREQYAYMRNTYPGFYNRTFGRAAADGEGRILLQYWLFYFHQEAVDFGPTLEFGEHQGDWELVTVRLDPTTLEPDRAFYAQHGRDGQSCAWEDVGHSFTSYNPDVYVAQTTHASYFVSGRSGAHPQDIADGDGDSLVPQVGVIKSDAPGWVSWPGHWGGSADDPLGNTAQSPRGPAFQEQWEDHDSWASGLDDACD